MNKLVLVIGEGMLAKFVCELLQRNHTFDVICQQKWTNTTVPDIKAQLAVVLHDSWHPAIFRQAEERFRKAGIPWLRAFVAFGQGIIGPLVMKEIPGCSGCADKRRIMAEQERNEVFHLQSMLSKYGGQKNDAWSSSTGLLHMAHLLDAEIEKVLNEPERSFLVHHMTYVNLKTLSTSRHFFLPDPNCEICGEKEKDSPLEAVIMLESSPKIKDDSYRSRDLYELWQNLNEEYVDSRTGLLNGKINDLITPFTAVSVNLPLIMGDEGAGGRSHSYKESTMTAILEGLERYCGLEIRGKKPAVYNSYANLKNEALNPEKVGLHAPKEYAKPGFPFQPYSQDLAFNWVYGYSLIEERPILVPELLAYYSLGCRPGFVYETSNGCAIGSSMVEAIFHGLLEVVERDAFLMTWYARLPLTQIAVSSIDDLECKWMVERMRAVTGYDLLLFNATMENQIPSVFAIAKNKRAKGLNLICAGGSHLDPVRAVKGAIHELAGMLLRFDEKLEVNRGHYMQMLKDSSQVREMEDHSMLYGLPEAEERFTFLLNREESVEPFTDAFCPWKKFTDLKENLLDILSVFRKLGLDVIVVNQTSSELRKNGLHCVKVLIPGMLPMTFGHHLVRLYGLDRVLSIPKELGYTSQPLTPTELNPYPHPFP